ncbi:MAG: Heavy-metal-associated domain [Chloroflexi bacterium]|nr:Heavy-metal-associated domain [Chloroflexota bacterium]
MSERLSLSVATLDCDRCVAEVEQALRTAIGIESVAVDLTVSTVSVVFDRTQTNADTIAALLDEAGYPASH